jgi:adenylate kinase
MLGRKVVIFTGQSGTDKATRIDNLKKVAVSVGRDVKYFSLGDMMYEKTGAEPGRILKLPLSQLEMARQSVVDEIVAFLAEHVKSDVYINTHATFRWEDGVFSGFSASEIRSLNPSMCVCFVSDIDDVQVGLRRANYPWTLSLRDIMFWREEEMLCTELMAGISQASHYVVPLVLRPAALYRLVYEPESQRLYVSFPISNVPTNGMSAEIDGFRERFHGLKSVVVFDPIEITSEPVFLKNADKYMKANPEAKKVTIEKDGTTSDFSVSEINEVRSQINSRTRSFDYRMVEQSQEVVAFVPLHEGDPFTAEGVMMELAYAKFARGIKITLVWPSKERPPSLMIGADRVVDTVDKAVELFS